MTSRRRSKGRPRSHSVEAAESAELGPHVWLLGREDASLLTHFGGSFDLPPLCSASPGPCAAYARWSADFAWREAYKLVQAEGIEIAPVRDPPRLPDSWPSDARSVAAEAADGVLEQDGDAWQ